MGKSSGSAGQAESAEARRLYQIQGDIARQQWDMFQRQGAPILESMSAEAQQGPSAARFSERIGQAGADVTQSFTQQRDASAREMARYGVNPSSGRFVGMNRGLDLAEAGTRAAAMTTARRGVDDETWRRQADVFGLASGQGSQGQQGLASAAAGFQGIADREQQAATARRQGSGMLLGSAMSAGAIAF